MGRQDAGPADGAGASESLNEESDAKAPVKGADAQGESAPDAETEPGSLTGPAPDLGSETTPAGEDVAQLAAARQSAPEVLEVRQGMFGVQGSGDTSGYGGLTRTIEFPRASDPPFGGWWDQMYDRITELVGDVAARTARRRGLGLGGDPQGGGAPR